MGTPAEGDEYAIGSCKYKNEPVGADEYETLKHYASIFGKDRKCHCFVFSKGGFTPSLMKLSRSEDLTLVTLAELYRR